MSHELGHVLAGMGHVRNGTLRDTYARTVGPDGRFHVMWGGTDGAVDDGVNGKKRMDERYINFARQQGMEGVIPVLFPESGPREFSSEPMLGPTLFVSPGTILTSP